MCSIILRYTVNWVYAQLVEIEGVEFLNVSRCLVNLEWVMFWPAIFGH